MAKARIPVVRKLKTLPSGPTVPPVSHLAPCKEAFDRCPSKTMPLSQLDEYAETFLGQRLSTVDGVAQVQVFGSQKYAVRIQLDPQQLAARNIGIDEVAEVQAAGRRRCAHERRQRH